MSDQTQEFDESTLSPEVIAHFEKKYAPVITKKAELQGQLGKVKGEIDALGGLDSLKELKTKADEAAAAAERSRLDALAKEGKNSEIEEHFRKLLAEKDATLTKYQQKVINKEVESKLAKAISEADGNPALLTHLLRERVEAFMNDEGEVVLTVKGAAGQTMGDDGKPLTLKALVSEFKANDSYAGAFKAHQASGGSNTRTATASGNNPFASATANVTKQFELIKSDPALARTLAAEAGVDPTW